MNKQLGLDLFKKRKNRLIYNHIQIVEKVKG